MLFGFTIVFLVIPLVSDQWKYSPISRSIIMTFSSLMFGDAQSIFLIQSYKMGRRFLCGIIDHLSWKWQHKDVIMTQQNGFVVLNKKYDIWWHFLFCCIWFMWQMCVICPQHMTAELAFYIFIFMIVLNLSFQLKNSKHKSPFSLTVLWGWVTKTTNIATMATDCFLQNQPFWRLWLSTPLPSNKAG